MYGWVDCRILPNPVDVPTEKCLSLEAIPVSGDPRPCRDQMAPPFSKDSCHRMLRAIQGNMNNRNNHYMADIDYSAAGFPWYSLLRIIARSLFKLIATGLPMTFWTDFSHAYINLHEDKACCRDSVHI